MDKGIFVAEPLLMYLPVADAVLAGHPWAEWFGTSNSMV